MQDTYFVRIRSYLPSLARPASFSAAPKSCAQHRTAVSPPAAIRQCAPVVGPLALHPGSPWKTRLDMQSWEDWERTGDGRRQDQLRSYIRELRLRGETFQEVTRITRTYRRHCDDVNDENTAFRRSYGPFLFLQNITQGARRRGRCPQKATDMLVVELSGASRGESAQPTSAPPATVRPCPGCMEGCNC